jgi:hypothetical protein
MWLTAEVTDIDLKSNLVSYVGAGGESGILLMIIWRWLAARAAVSPARCRCDRESYA